VAVDLLPGDSFLELELKGPAWARVLSLMFIGLLVLACLWPLARAWKLPGAGPGALLVVFLLSFSGPAPAAQGQDFSFIRWRRLQEAGDVTLKMGQPKEAQSFYSRAWQQSEKGDNTFRSLSAYGIGEALYQQRRYLEAAKWFEACLNLSRASVPVPIKLWQDCHWKLGEIQWFFQRRPSGREHYLQALFCRASWDKAARPLAWKFIKGKAPAVSSRGYKAYMESLRDAALKP
jgi:tetratricopeptide (TPR) repeat protein